MIACTPGGQDVGMAWKCCDVIPTWFGLDFEASIHTCACFPSENFLWLVFDIGVGWRTLMALHKAACLFIADSCTQIHAFRSTYHNRWILFNIIRDVDCSIMDSESVHAVWHGWHHHANKLTFQFNDQPIILFTEYNTSIIQVLI